MSMIKGIDVSKHNGKIDWSQVKGQIEFAMIRAGYGKNNIDEKLDYNVKGCKENGIHFGFYWFSYALSLDDVSKEAKYVCDLADKYEPDYPIAFDWEYDSDTYSQKKGLKISNATRALYAERFLSEVEKRGYYAMNYTNIDYLSKGFDSIMTRFDTWLAQWTTAEKPGRPCGIWQYSSKGKIKGIPGYVDLNYAYKDYASIIAGYKNGKVVKDYSEIIKDIAVAKQVFENDFAENYTVIANEVIAGVHGNGKGRKDKLQSLGYDAQLMQMIVNRLVKK